MATSERRWLGNLLLLALATGGVAQAEVREAAADAAAIAITTPVAATPAKVWQALLAVPKWWGNDYTFSGKAANLSLAPAAGGCLCERWDGASVEHARVLMLLPERLLRLDTALGPLQEYPLRGVLNFWLRYAEDGSAVLDLEYRVAGATESGLDQLAPQIDAQLRDQAERLARLAETGKAELPPAPPAEGETKAAPEDQTRSTARTAILEAWKKSAEEMLRQGEGKRQP